MVRRRVCGSIAILFTMWALLGACAAEARNRRPRPPRRCHPGTLCRHRTGFCNDAGRCCNTTDGDVACGSECCEFPTQACCDGHTCTDLLQNDNCGGCGIVCSGGRTCQNLVCTCPQGTTECEGECVDTQSDDDNCGGCGNVCSGGKSCENGVCTCPHGGTDCGGVCVNLLFDDANCGACGNACDADQKCFLGTCGCSDATQLLCDGQCVDGFSDRNNCGQCGNVCPAGQDCVGGSCQAPCTPCEELVNTVCVLKDPGKDTLCDGVCVDISNDPNNCGACGTVCPSGKACTDGTCDVCPSEPVEYTTCPVNDPGGHVVAVCCSPEAPGCCYNSHGFASCCGNDTTCCDGYCCPAGTHCCVNPRGSYPCIPDGQPCPG